MVTTRKTRSKTPVRRPASTKKKVTKRRPASAKKAKSTRSKRTPRSLEVFPHIGQTDVFRKAVKKFSK